MKPLKIQLALLASLAIIFGSLTAARAAAAASSPSRTALATVASAPNAILRREVFGFVNAASLGDAVVGYPSWDFTHLSTVAYFAIHVNATDGGLIGDDTGWYVFHSTTMTNFVAKAHGYGVRVIVSINVHDGSTDPNNRTCTDLAPSVAQTTISETVSEVQKAGIDGVNINYEGQLTTCANGATNRAELVAFAKNMRAALPQGDYLSVDTYSGSAEDNLEFFDVTGLAPYVDSMFVMAYDMDWANYSEAPLNCSTYCFNPVSPLNTYRFNVTKSMQQYTALVPANKVILGQPLYGSRGCVDGPSPAHQTLRSNYVNTTYIYASTIASQSGVSQLGKHRDPSDGVSEWDTWWDTDWNCWREQYYDDVYSMGFKFDVVNQLNLRGVGLFTLDYAGGAPELWHELDVKFATTTPWTSLGGVVAGSPIVVSSGASRMDVFIRGVEGHLWHQSWNGTAWSGWEDLGGVLGADPNVVATSPTRLDVFIRGQEGGLWQRTWDGTAWGGWQSLGGVIVGPPSAVSLNSTRLDVFIQGQEGGLWQRTWTGTAWGGWQGLGGVLTTAPTALAVGGNRIDLFHRGTDYALWERSWDSTNGWGGFKSLGGYLPGDRPAILDTSGRIDVFARGWDSGLWQDTWNGGAWGGWASHGGVMPSAPMATSCSAGHMDVFHIGTDGAIWQLGYNGTAWGAFQRLGGQWTGGPSGFCAAGATTASMFALDYYRAVWQTAVPTT